MRTNVERTMQPLRDDSRAPLKIRFDLRGAVREQFDSLHGLGFPEI